MRLWLQIRTGTPAEEAHLPLCLLPFFPVVANFVLGSGYCVVRNQDPRIPATCPMSETKTAPAIALPKWEYCFVRLNYFAGDFRPQSINGEDLRDKPIPNLHDFTNQLGDQGWELVGVNYTPGYGYGFLIFKRPKVTLEN